jgi:hypothetical protein
MFPEDGSRLLPLNETHTCVDLAFTLPYNQQDQLSKHVNIIIIIIIMSILHNLYSSPSIIRMIKSRMMRWQGM